MPRSESDRDDIFFDAFDDISSTREPSLSHDCSTSDEGLASRRFEYNIWANEPTNVEERRQRFLKGMGFDEFVATRVEFSQHQGEITTVGSFSDLEEGSTRDISSMDSSVAENESVSDGSCCIRDRDSVQRCAVQNDGYGELTSVLKEVASQKAMSLLEFEGLPGISQSVQKLLRKVYSSSAEDKKGVLNGKKKGVKSLWKSFVKNRSFGGICKYDDNVKICTTGSPSRTRVQHRKKKIVEFSAVQMGQEIQAHKGIIKAMKFSPSGWYLATGGEDCVVRIWQIMEVEMSSKLYGGDNPDYDDKITVIKTKLGRGQNQALAVLPNKSIRISETPLHEFQGHTDDILDMAWSKSDHLLTSSKDKTVCLWKVGCDGCLSLFKHKDYVTCVQFNPFDERYFISGSIDGKVRVWDALDKRVVDWADTRKIITALSYQPDGRGFIVGTTSGECRFYNQSGENIQLDKELLVHGKKSAVRLVNSLQLCTSDPSRITITSTGSKIRVAHGVDIIQKFEGPWNLKALSSPSLTSDGRYLISAGLDSNVYIWNFDITSIAEQKGEAKSVHSCEKFFSKDVTTAVPWPGVHQERQQVKTSSLTEESVSSPILHRHGERRSPAARCFTDGMKGTLTWPEEKLPSAKTAEAPRLSDCLSMISPAWNTVIVTASRDGVIRCFHNYGLPVRLISCKGKAICFGIV